MHIEFKISETGRRLAILTDVNSFTLLSRSSWSI